MNVTIRHTAKDGTTLQGLRYVEITDDTATGEEIEASNVAEGHGFRYSPRGLYFLPKTQGLAAKEFVIEMCAARLRNAGHTVTVDI